MLKGLSLEKKQIVSFVVCQGLKAIISCYLTPFFSLFVLNSINLLLFYFSHLVKKGQNVQIIHPLSVIHGFIALVILPTVKNLGLAKINYTSKCFQC